MLKNTPNKIRFHELDLIRFIAALVVVLFHYFFRGNAGNTPYTNIRFSHNIDLIKYGYLGVDLFFIISGFVILMTARNNIPTKFIRSRFLRLYPVYWLCLLITALFIAVSRDNAFSISLPQILGNLTMIQEALKIESIDGVYWSLFVELKFYALVTVAMLLNVLRFTKSLLIAWIAITIFERVFFNSLYIRYFFITEWSPYFIAGAIYYLVRMEGWCSVKLTTLALSIAMSLHNALAKMYNLEETLLTTYSYPTIISIILLIYLLMGLVATNRLNIANRKQMFMLGAVSYPLYLLHQFIGYILINRFSGQINSLLLVFFVTVFAIFLSYAVVKLFEHPLRNRLRRQKSH